LLWFSPFCCRSPFVCHSRRESASVLLPSSWAQPRNSANGAPYLSLGRIGVPSERSLLAGVE
jgi:hypothetical protein